MSDRRPISDEAGVMIGVALLIAAVNSGRNALHMLGQTDKPSATTEARLEEEGVPNPERAGSQLADEYRRAS